MSGETFINDVRAAIETRLAAWQNDPLNGVAGRVAYDGFSPEPAWGGLRHAVVKIEFQIAASATAGSPTVTDRTDGALLVWIREPAGDGVGNLCVCADRLSSLMRRWSIGGASFQLAMQAPYLAGAPVRDGAFMVLAWRCQFSVLGQFAAIPSP